MAGPQRLVAITQDRQAHDYATYVVLDDRCQCTMCVMAAQGTRHKPVLDCTMVGTTGDMMEVMRGRQEGRVGDTLAGGM